ncbi:aminoglycoside phosphotransferase family protein [Piscinibacter defluvii]|uniref:aminoglycoside phosphotransferase family protein n=1 Tax=Piscinibacter defluvii TaxID=1796922 RepID=UPI000FDDB971|nr:aminoglycoside phosphotransferase family protein [Piscinibacter defluvii]
MDALTEALRTALRAQHSPWADAPIAPLADAGLAHAHLRLVGTGVLARVPKQSQLDLPAAANLAYQAACFERAAPSGHVPRLHGMLPPGDALPRGALLVEEIVGRPARMPQDLPAIVDALAAIHALPLPAQRAPLLDAPDPLALLHAEIEAQAVHLDAAALDASSRRAIDAQRRRFEALLAAPARPGRRLIAFDAHPGNFLLHDGRAVLVDLEKARYSHPPLDLAHATLYTSTTWDRASAAVLGVDEVAAAGARWLARVGDAPAWQTWLVPLRAAMWLWSVTWCAKWRVLSGRAARAGGDGEDWSAAHSDAALVAHVRERVDDYLSGAGVARVVDELAQLARRAG